MSDTTTSTTTGVVTSTTTSLITGRMQLVGLNGTDVPLINRFIPGKIDDLFGKGCYPYRRFWNTWNEHRIERQIRDIQGFIKDPYLLVGFSSGGNFAQILSSRDDNCRGVVIHSAQFMKEPPRKIPTLIMSTDNDKSGVNRDLKEMIEWYRINIGNDLVTVFSQIPTTRMGHEFTMNSVSFVKSWYEKTFKQSWEILW